MNVNECAAKHGGGGRYQSRGYSVASEGLWEDKNTHIVCLTCEPA